MNLKILTTTHWLQLSNEERAEMRDVLKIPRSGGTIVEDNKIKSDGCTESDLAVVTVSKLQEVLDSTEEDFFVLWEEAVDKIRARVEDKKREMSAFQNVQRLEEEEKNAMITATVTLNAIKKLPLYVQTLIYQEMGKMFEIKEDNTQKNEQKESTGEESTGAERTKATRVRKGGSKTEGAGD